MSARILVYKTGERYYMDGLTLRLRGGEIDCEYDLTNATETELEQLKLNPHNDKLLAEISKRG